MNLLFCNEGPIYQDEHGNYFAGALNTDFFEKYYQLADHITICIRVKKIANSEGDKRFSKLDVSNKTIVKVPDLMTVKGLCQRREAKGILEKEIDNADIVVVRVPSIIGDLAARVAKQKNVKCIADVVGCPWDSMWNHSIKGKVLAVPMFLSQRKTVREADYSVYVTNEFLQRRYPSCNKTIGLSDVLLEDVDIEQLSKRLEHIRNHNGKYILGTTAAVNVRYKGQDRVIAALGELKKKGIDNFEYQLVGGGNPDYLLKVAKDNNVSENVVIIGSLPHDKIFSWLDTIDIYMQPSFQEGLSRALIEAMSRATPCVVSDVGGNPELICSEWVYNRKHSISCLVELLSKIDDKCLVKMAEDNFRKSQNYQRKLLEKRRREFYESIIGEMSNYNRI